MRSCVDYLMPLFGGYQLAWLVKKNARVGKIGRLKVYWEDHIARVIFHSQAYCQDKELGKST